MGTCRINFLEHYNLHVYIDEPKTKREANRPGERESAFLTQEQPPKTENTQHTQEAHLSARQIGRVSPFLAKQSE